MAERDLPHFTTDIAAAWTVVEKMQADGWWATATYRTDGGPTEDAEWFVELREIEGPWRESLAHDPTLPLAIVLAALRAKEGDR